MGVVGGQNFVISNAQCGLAAVRTMRAYRRDVSHLPGTRLVSVRAARQRADRADIDAHAAFFAVQMILSIRDDHSLRTALAQAERLDVQPLIAHANAAA